ncbi:LysR family transcriptional regulator [Reinekea blandensis]|uniref:Transcriptional regulator n=1 Tax=Reinekea blandensis MED297 TaxID=314283 RepID=A4BGW9_9GAMM|nr:LysR family transcriptional regulator [Reinekea blandensis]EAR08615.1 transcriptional regulator [Reinekea sp. MED297] [Reinekea blandensis MED297]
MPTKTINFRHLKLFSEVARLHSINAAAEQNFVTQSALTQAILKMEKQLGADLFQRRHNGMFLTDAGDMFLLRTRRCLNFLDTGVKESQNNRNRSSAKQALLHSENMTHVQLRTLIALQHTTSFSAAAREMNVSQPAVYRAARDLESLLDMSLFEKTSHGIALTKAAKNLTRYVLLAFRELELAFTELAELNGSDITHIAIGSMPLARTILLPRAIDRLSSLKPDVSISIVDGPYDDLLMRLLNGELDFLVGALRDPPPSTDVEQTAMFDSPLQIAARNGHPLVEQSDIQLSDLAEYSWVLPRTGTPTRTIFENLIGQHLESRGGLIECSSQSLIHQLLHNSNRLTFLSSHQLEQEIQEGRMKALDFSLPGATRPIGITTRKDWHPTTTQQLFISIIRNLSNEMTAAQTH